MLSGVDMKTNVDARNQMAVRQCVPEDALLRVKSCSLFAFAAEALGLPGV